MLSATRLAQCGAVAATLFFANAASAVTINSFQFNGALEVIGDGAAPATISFRPNFSILSQNGAVAGDLIGLNGDIAGNYTFADPAGANTVALSSPAAPNGFTIDDGVSDTFAADIDLIQLQDGGGGSIIGAIDFSSSTYGGANAGLIALNDLIQNTPDLTVTFQVLGGGGVDLDDLFQNGSGGVATFSAAVNVNQNPTATPVPEPGPLALLGLGLLCSVAFASRKRAVSAS